MSTEISVVNVTNPSFVQSPWWQSVRTCYRPPNDYGLPIVCHGIYDHTKISNRTSINATGSDFGLYQDCCPLHGHVPRNTTYWLQANCGFFACFTDNVTVAEGWGRCLRDTLGEEIERTGGNSTEEAIEGKCEYVNYELLRKGVSGGAGRGQGLRTWAVVTVAVIAGVLSAL